ncbi:hypothetical protein BUALT_Bualt16G0111600 [Buddleja alternifolia]|uniref:Uncharacterized protein n=1 Tax=Buddleja alternifolia TaxID=168488 RepID=A0AAV6WHC3_9LAMI|nr:hypothetical protein BUALT_Bualt16G0111600 [Buddleja alternifolia]
MANTSVSLDKWRDYFRGANYDIFNIIEGAIMVAAIDCPYDFKLKRDRIAEMLFTCKVTKCFGCDRIELAVPSDGTGGEKSDEDDEDDKYKSGVEAGGSKDTKESKVNSSGYDYDDDHDDHREDVEMNVNQVSNYSYGDAEALTNEIDEESQYFDEVLRIKEILDNSEDKSDEWLFDSLRRLRLMPLSVETLKVRLEFVLLVDYSDPFFQKQLERDWKTMVDAWVSATTAIAEVATESVKTSAEEEEEEDGLPSPPLDEGAFFTTPASMELSQFFDGMDDDGNPRNNGEFNKNRENGRKPRRDETHIVKRSFESPDDLNTPPKAEPKRNNHESMLKKQAPICKPNRPSNVESGPGRPRPPNGASGPMRPKPAAKPKVNNEIRVQQKSDKGSIQKKPIPHQNEKLNRNNEASVGMKLEAAKRKLQERYQEAENAKRQRTIQVVELRDLPKQNVERNHPTRPGNHNRQWANGRR